MTTVALRQAQRGGTIALAGREVRRVLSLWTQTILPAVVTAALFLAVFGGALGARIREREGLDYLDFILPGLLVMTVAAQSIANASTSLFQAKNEGYIDDVLTAPLRAWQIVAAYMAGAIARSLTPALVVAVAATPFTGAVERPLVATAALVVTGLVFSALGTIVGVWADTFDQHSFVVRSSSPRSPFTAGCSTRQGRSRSRGRRSRGLTRSTTSSTPRGSASPASTKARSASRSRSQRLSPAQRLPPRQRSSRAAGA